MLIMMALLALIPVLLISFVGTSSAAYLPQARAIFGPNTGKYVVDKLPNITYHIPPNWAGQIRIPGTKDDELFFWLFETEDQSQCDNLISMIVNFRSSIPTNSFTSLA